jgi:hypothetical protein
MKIIFFLLIFFFTGDNSQLSYFLNSSNKPIRTKLPDELYEISGLTFDNSGNLFCHNDEEGTLYLVDIKTGTIADKIFPGDEIIYGDFEDVCFHKGIFYLLRSDGKIYIIDKEASKKRPLIIETGLTEKNNCEGLCFDEKNNSLLIACKDFPGKKMKGFRAVYSFSLSKNKLNLNLRFLISLIKLKTDFGINDFYPSAITINKESNTYFILSAKGDPAIIEISESGKVLNAELLDKKNHPKPEGIAFYDNKLFISDEGVNTPAFISVYIKSKSKEK